MYPAGPGVTGCFLGLGKCMFVGDGPIRQANIVNIHFPGWLGAHVRMIDPVGSRRERSPGPI